MIPRQKPIANSQKRLSSFFSPAPLLPCSLTLLLLVLLALAFAGPAFSQQTWERTYGGTKGDWGYSVQQTTDGGYIVAGYTTSFGADSGDVYLIKTNASGDTLWTKTYRGDSIAVGYSLQQSSDGGYIITGMTRSYGQFGGDVYLIKTNTSGDTLWTRTFGGASDDEGMSVQQTTDGGYIIAGWTDSYGPALWNVYLIKTNALGDTLWTRFYRGGPDNEGMSVQQTSDGGYVVAGRTYSSSSYYDVFLIKTNASGDSLWARTYGGTNDEEGYSVQQTSDGGYIVAGYTNSFGAGGFDVYLIKTNASGDTLWTRTYGGRVGGVNAMGYSVQQTTDGGYIIAGTTNSFGVGGYDVYLIKTNASGDTLWTRTFGGAGDDVGYSVRQTQDGGYIIAGYTYSNITLFDVYLIKTDANGNVGVEEQGGSRQKAVGSLKVTPNPFVSYATIPGHSSDLFVLYDVAGRKVGMYKGERIGADLSPGVYFLRSSGKDSRPLRLVKLK